MITNRAMLANTSWAPGRARSRASRFVVIAIGVASVLAPTLTMAVVAAPTAEAATYRYWSYWSISAHPNSATSWKYASSGPASRVPADGEVDGWRFGVSADSSTRSRAPRVTAATAFDELCGATNPVDGSKRVAVVIDYGDASDAPSGQTPPKARGGCVVAPMADTGAMVLTSAPISAGMRVKAGLICAIDRYPVGECAPVVTDPTPQLTSNATASAKPIPTAAHSSTTARSGTSPAAASTAGSSTAGSSTTQSPGTRPSDPNFSSAAPPPEPASSNESPVALSTTPPIDSGGSGSAVGVVAGGLVIAGLGAVAWYLGRRGHA